MENKSLFQKLLDKINFEKIRTSCIVKKVIKGMCAVALALSLVFTTSCENTNNNNNNNNNNTHNSDQNNNKDNKYSQYSQVLQNVLNSNYYNWLIQEAEIDKENRDFTYEQSNAYKAIPYGFLEDEGFDVEAIKNNNLKCETETFVLNDEPNSLYLTCRVENKASIDYYTHFVLKYNLTEQELKDLKLVYKNISQGQGVSFQAPFFIQELSQVKEATKLSEMNITKESEKEAKKHIETDNFRSVDLSMFSNAITITYVKEKSETSTASSHSYAFFNTLHSNSTQPIKKITQISITVLSPQTTLIDGENVYNGVVGTLIIDRNINVVNDNMKTATFYVSNDLSLVNMLNEDYKNTYGIDK